MRYITLYFLLLLPTYVYAEAQIKSPSAGSCDLGYFLISDVCVHSSLLGNTDKLVDAIMEYKDPSYVAKKEKLKQLQQQQKQLVSEKSKNNPRVIPFPSSGYIFSHDGSSVACTKQYSSYEHSHDGSSVCAGGEYSSYEHSHDGSDVACGGEYSSYEHSHDGSSVCAGGEYSSYEHSHDGSDVTCGGEYDGWQDSHDGKRVCVGGNFNGCVHSKDGSHVACGSAK